MATALGGAAAQAKILADQEEREMEHLAATVIDQQVSLNIRKLCLYSLSVCVLTRTVSVVFIKFS